MYAVTHTPQILQLSYFMDCWVTSPAWWTELGSGTRSNLMLRSLDQDCRHKQESPELHQYPEGEPKFQNTAEFRVAELNFLWVSMF